MSGKDKPRGCAALLPAGWYPLPNETERLRWWDGESWTAGARPIPAAGWYLDPERQGLLRWWDGTSWTAQCAPLPAPERQIWTRWFVILMVTWLATLAVSIGTAMAIVAHESGRESWWPASVPLLVELLWTLAIGAVLGCRRRWQEAYVLAGSSSIVVLGVFMVGAAVSSDPAADNEAGAGFVILGLPATAAIAAVVLTGALLGTGYRLARGALASRRGSGSGQ